MATEKLLANHILVGLGGTGGKILREFKKRLFEEFGSKEEIVKQPIAILYVDSTDEMMSKDGRPHPDFMVLGKDASFTPAEFLNIKGVDVDYILNHSENYTQIKGIVSNAEAVKSAIGNLGEAAGQKRRAGRLLFAVNAEKYVGKLKAAYAQCQAASAQGAGGTYIHILTGLSGGTGSGSIIDVIVQTRKNYPEANISVYAMIPESHLPEEGMDKGRYYPNGYAALRELNALQTGRWFPQDVTGDGPAEFRDNRGYTDGRKGVANGLTLYSYENENDFAVHSLNALPQIVSDYLFARILMLDVTDDANKKIKDAYAFENMDDDALEYDENVAEVKVARTRKLNSFGIKRIIYPTTRMQQHITYTIGRSILNQFRYNHWRDNEGYVDEDSNRDYRQEFLNKENLQKWMLDFAHLTLERKVLGTDPDYPTFNDYWHNKAIERAEEAKEADRDRPLQELDRIMGDFYMNYFRDEGVEGYYKGKEKAIPEIAKEIRRKVERDLFGMWKQGGEHDISIIGLQKVSKLLLEKMGEIRKDLETKSREEKENYDSYDLDRTNNVEEWSRLGILQRMINKSARLYAEHQDILTDYYESKTMLVAWEFAKKLAAKIETELGDMDSDISRFSAKINDAIKDTEKLVAAQRKVNNGLDEDKEMKGIVIEVSEDEAMETFEKELKADKKEMPDIARQIRKSIFPDDEFYFGKAANIDMERIKNAFDTTLMEIVGNKHDEGNIVKKDKKVLGLNILTQLRQQLKTDEDIRGFANKIVNQSGVFLKLDQNQILLDLPNNDSKGKSWDATLNQKVRLVSMPAPDDDTDLGYFADKLERALKEVDNTIIVNKKSPRREELSIITVSYCYPMRAISWLRTYKEKYERFMNTGNRTTDMNNAILLHSEGTGEDLPSLFALDDADKVPTKAKPNTKIQMPPSIPTTKPVTPPLWKVLFRLHIAIGGQQYGPYDIDQCKQMVASGQLTQQSMVWMEGLPAWTAAGQVPALSALFAPTPSSNMPPLPPTGGSTPPPML